MTGKRKGRLFIVSAPSGAGKTSLCKRLVEMLPDLDFSVSYTTRGMRPGEVEGGDYFFVSREAFKRMAEGGGFLEWAEVHGNLYGTSRRWIEGALEKGGDVLLDIDVQGARQLRKTVSGPAEFVFVLPPSREALRQRLVSRGSDSAEVIEERLRAATEEIKEYLNYNYVIVNDDFEQALREFEAVVVAGRVRGEAIEPDWIKAEFFGEEDV